MPKLSFTPATASVTLPDGNSLVVRGLSFEDVVVLIREYREPIKFLFETYVNEATQAVVDDQIAGGALGLGDMSNVIYQALDVAPGLLRLAISRASDVPAEDLRMLPIGVYVEAISQIFRLTLEAEGGMEKLVETVSRITESVAALKVSRSR